MAMMARPITLTPNTARAPCPRIPRSSPKTARFMQGDHGGAAVKTGCAKGLVGALSCNQPFQSFTAASRAAECLLFGACAVTSSGAFPDKTCRVLQANERSPIHLSHAGSDQDLSSRQEGAGERQPVVLPGRQDRRARRQRLRQVDF